MLGALPALLVFYVQARVEESPVWLAAAKKRRASRERESYAKNLAALKSFVPTFLFLIVLMTAFMSSRTGRRMCIRLFLQCRCSLTPQDGRD